MSKVGYLIPQFPGQTHIFFWREVTALRRWGVDVKFISTRRPPANIVSHAWSAEAVAQTTYLFPAGTKATLLGLLEVLRAGPKRWVKCAGAILKAEDASLGTRLKMGVLMLAGGQVARIAKHERLSHLHVHSCADSALVAMFAHLLSGLPYSVTLHSPLSMYGPAQLLKWGHAQFGIAVTERLRREVLQALEGLSADKIEVAAMGVDLQVFQRSMPYDPQPRDGKWKVVSCGRLHIGKGHQDLIEAVAILRSQGFDVELTVLGEGPARAELEERIRRLGLGSVVRLAGAVSEAIVCDELQRANVFCLGSHDEAIGVATMEAMAMGLPVVVTDVGGVRELVREGIDGLFVPPRNPQAMAEAIAGILREPEVATRMGESGAERVRKHFSSEVSARVIARRLGIEEPAAFERGQAASSGVTVV